MRGKPCLVVATALCTAYFACGGPSGPAPGDGVNEPGLGVDLPEDDAGNPGPGNPGEDAGTSSGPPSDAGVIGSADGGEANLQPGWNAAYSEPFSPGAMPTAQWQPDPVPADGPFADEGEYFTSRGIQAPPAFRASVPFGASGWLTLESYTRSAGRDFAQHASVVEDPAQPGNYVLRIASPDHTDATVVRPTQPLPARYRVTLRVGFADFGHGAPGANGYDGGETAEPWRDEDATTQNGFYWLAILDAVPRPHNNVWIHHHRKVVIDSDNHYPPWMEIWDGQQFVSSGSHPVMMFALDGRGAGTEETGKPFISWSAGKWQPPGAIRAVDAYLMNEWYQVTLERSEGVFTLEVSGKFRYGGQQTYRASINASENCVWHFNRTPEEDAAHCVDETGYPALPGFPHWPAGATWPDYFMFGDPHENFYEGSVLYDDVKLETWVD